LSGGLLTGARLMAFIRSILDDVPIEELEIPYAAVATTLHTGAEVWLRAGSVHEAVRASMAMPGLFTPSPHGESLLIDGALVNPVPVSLGRAMGADVLIAVDLSSDILKRHLIVEAEPDRLDGNGGEWLRKLRGYSSGPRGGSHTRRPSMVNVIASSLDIMQVRITRHRMAGEPPDIAVTPRLGHLGLFDFHRAEEAIDEGERAMTAALEHLQFLGIAAH